MSTDGRMDETKTIVPFEFSRGTIKYKYLSLLSLLAVGIEILRLVSRFIDSVVCKYAGTRWNFVKLTKFQYATAYLLIDTYALRIHRQMRQL